MTILQAAAVRRGAADVSRRGPHRRTACGTVVAQARCLEGNIGGVRVTKAEISDQELRDPDAAQDGRRPHEHRQSLQGIRPQGEGRRKVRPGPGRLRRRRRRRPQARRRAAGSRPTCSSGTSTSRWTSSTWPPPCASGCRASSPTAASSMTPCCNWPTSPGSRATCSGRSAFTRGWSACRPASSAAKPSSASPSATKRWPPRQPKAAAAAQLQDRAFQEYKKVYDQFPESGRVGEAVAKMANYYYKQKDYARAIDTFETVLNNHPDAKFLDVILFNYGRCLYRMERKAEAKQRFDQLIGEFPESPLAADAKKISEALAKARNVATSLSFEITCHSVICGYACHETNNSSSAACASPCLPRRVAAQRAAAAAARCARSADGRCHRPAGGDARSRTGQVQGHLARSGRGDGQAGRSLSRRRPAVRAGARSARSSSPPIRPMPRHQAVMLKLIDGLEALSRNKELAATIRQFLARYPQAAGVRRAGSPPGRRADPAGRPAAGRRSLPRRVAAARRQRNRPPLRRARGVQLFSVIGSGESIAAGRRARRGDARQAAGRRIRPADRPPGVPRIPPHQPMGQERPASARSCSQKGLAGDAEAQRQLHMWMAENHGNLGQHANAAAESSPGPRDPRRSVRALPC